MRGVSISLLCVCRVLRVYAKRTSIVVHTVPILANMTTVLPMGPLAADWTTDMMASSSGANVRSSDSGKSEMYFSSAGGWCGGPVALRSATSSTSWL